MKKSLILGSILIFTLLAACGGSSDSGTDPNATTPGVGAVNIDKYVGTWSSCFAAGTGSKQKTVILTKFSDSKTTAVFLATEFSYASSDCSGAATMTFSTGTVVLNGSKSLGVDIVDKAIVNTEGAAPEKQVYLIKGTGPVTLTSGRVGGDVDADGYPTTLEGNSLTKQGAALEKYLGTWRSCVASGNGSEEEILTLTKATDSSAYFSWTKTSYSSSTHCSGTGLGSETEGGFLLEGTKNIGTETVDKVIISANLRPMQKQVFLIKGTGPATLTPGRIDGGLDADGYPTTLDSSFLTK